MDTARFTNPEAGRCVRIEGGHLAFVPGPLPGRIDINGIWGPLGGADAALGAISGLTAGPRLPFLQMLVSSAVRREAAQSSRIEGIRTGLPDLLRSEVEDPANRAGKDEDLRETRNYVGALGIGVDALRSGQEISASLLRGLHRRLLEGTRGDHLQPGSFRTRQNLIGTPGSTLADAAYVPPPAHEIDRLIDDWVAFARLREHMPDLAACAILHHRLEAIHPFLDGNGRVGRLMIPLHLISCGRLAEPLLYVSDFFERRRAEYYDQLQRVHETGDWTPWICFFLRGVDHASRRAVEQANELAGLRQRLRAKLKKKFRARDLLEGLLENPYTNSATAAKRLAVARNTGQATIDLLVKAGILREVTGKQRDRLWVADEILEVIARDVM